MGFSKFVVVGSACSPHGPSGGTPTFTQTRELKKWECSDAGTICSFIIRAFYNVRVSQERLPLFSGGMGDCKFGS